MTYQTIEFSVADNIATIQLDRANDANALNSVMADELHDASIQCATRPDVRCVIITGKGKLFCGGGDLNEFKDVGDQKEAHLLRMATILHAAVVRFSNLKAPVIMAVNGTAGGGGFSLLLAGDYVMASDKAKFVSAYTASGLTPDGSSTFFLAKHIGLLRAKELMLTNRVLTADEAQDWGLVTRVVPADELQNEAQKLAEKFARGPTQAFGGVKQLLQSTYSASMEAQLERETQGIAGMMTTHDGPHGLESFLEKKKPEFKGS